MSRNFRVTANALQELDGLLPLCFGFGLTHELRHAFIIRLRRKICQMDKNSRNYVREYKNQRGF
jgi:hypothetical protein